MRLARIRLLACIAVVNASGPLKPPLSAFPSSLPVDAGGGFEIYVSPAVGKIFEEPGAGDNLTCSLHTSFYTQDTAARWINRSSVACQVPSEMQPAEGSGTIDVKLNNDWHYCAGGRAPIELFTLADVTTGRRTYLSNETVDAEMLIWPNFKAMSLFHPTTATSSVRICYSLPVENSSVTGCSAIKPGASSGPAASVPLRLPSKLPMPLDAELSIDVTLLPSGFRLPIKKRKLIIVQASGISGSFTTVDHRHRSLRVNGKMFVPNGFYTDVLWNLVPEYLKKLHPAPKASQVLSEKQVFDTITSLSIQGINQLQFYAMDLLDDATLARLLRHLETHGIYFGWGLTASVEQIVNATKGFNSTGTWDALVRSVRRVMHSPALLGWYVCDDCNVETRYPPKAMAKVFHELKKLDPYHISLGATWSCWSQYVFAESAGTLSVEYAMVENYLNQPAHHFYRDSSNRVGVRFEPLANSNGMFDLMPGFNRSNPANKGNFPATIEATLSWTSFITYGAVGQVNFLVDGRNWVSNWPEFNNAASYWDHIDQQAAYGRAVKQMLPALLPDITTKYANDNTLPVSIVRSTYCQTHVPAYQGHDSQVVGNVSVRVKGVTHPQQGETGYCGFMILVNLCETPTQFTLEAHGVPSTVKFAMHQFGAAAYKVPLRECTGHSPECGRQLTDWVDGYGNAVLQLGCDDEEQVSASTSSPLWV